MNIYDIYIFAIGIGVGISAAKNKVPFWKLVLITLIAQVLLDLHLLLK